MNIQYAVSDAALEEELENLVTHIAGEVYDTDDENNLIPVAHIEGSLVDVATAAEFAAIRNGYIFFRCAG